MYLILITLFFALFSVGLNRFVTKLFFTPCFWYWAMWLISLACFQFTAMFGDIRQLSEEAIKLIILLHIGAFIGFFLADFFWLLIKPKSGPKLEKLFGEIYSIPKWIIIVLIISTLVGFLSLASMISMYGFNIALFRGHYIAENYRQSQLPILTLFGVYSGIITSVIVLIIALKDIQRGRPNYRILGLLFFISLPGMLATGGRGALLSVIPPYAVVVLVLSYNYKLFHFKRKLLKFLIVILPITLVIISLVGKARTIEAIELDIKSPGEVLVQLLLPATTYISTPIAGMEGYAIFANHYHRTNSVLLGQTFPFLNRQLNRLGLSSSGSEFYGESRDWVFYNFDRNYGTTHATIIPALIADFGISYFWVGMIALSIIFELFFLKWSSKGIWGAMIIVWTCWYGTMNTPASNMFGSSGPMLQLGFVWIIARYCSKQSRLRSKKYATKMSDCYSHSPCL